MVGGFSFLMSGQLVVADTLIISAEVKFRLELAGANPASSYSSTASCRWARSAR